MRGAKQDLPTCLLGRKWASTAEFGFWHNQATPGHVLSPVRLLLLSADGRGDLLVGTRLSFRATGALGGGVDDVRWKATSRVLIGSIFGRAEASSRFSLQRTRKLLQAQVLTQAKYLRWSFISEKGCKG